MQYQKPGSLRTAEHQGLRSYIETNAEQERQVLDISTILDAIGRKLKRNMSLKSVWSVRARAETWSTAYGPPIKKQFFLGARRQKPERIILCLFIDYSEIATAALRTGG